MTEGRSLALRLARWLNWDPAPVEPVPVVEEGPARPLRRGEPFRVLSWNVQFCATRRGWFFYDGGPDVHVHPADRADGLAAVARVMREADADLVLLQEVDRRSARTGRVDQWAALRETVGPAAWATTPYHRSLYVPHPPRRPLGRVDLHLAIASRHGLAGARRLALPPLAEPPIRAAFNLHRALLTAEVPVDGGPPLAVAVTHLSAFSRGDGTLPRQVAILADWMEARRTAGQPFVLGGDLNLLPPGDSPARLGAEAAEYADHPNPLERLIPRFRSVVPPERLLDPAARTYYPPRAPVPDRVLDYVFVGEGVEVDEAGPMATGPDVSDHLPLLARLRLR